MSQYDYDLFVIGAGSGGVRAARMAAQYGARVAIAEQQYLGGTCVNVGCVPKKLFVYASSFSEEFATAQSFGWHEAHRAFDWQTLLQNKNREIERLNAIYGKLLDASGATLYSDRATVAGPHEISVGGNHYTSRYILVCTGGTPYVPTFPGSDKVITSDDAFFLETLPETIAIVGGGYIAVEFAGIFHGLGVDTHLIYRGPLFLRGFDQDLRESLAEQMQDKGIHLHFDCNVESVTESKSGLRATLNNGATLDADTIMYATGRVPNTQGLGLDTTAVVLKDNGAIEVDDHFQTQESSIYALGDVIDRMALTPVAIAEGMILADNLFRDADRTMNYDNIPTAVFSQPHLGTVGLTEEQARERYASVEVFRSEFKPMKQSLGKTNEKVLMKLVVDAKSDRVLGCHMLGEGAGEIIQGLAVAVKAGAKKADFDATVGIHPTAAEEFVTMRESVKTSN